MPLKKLLIITCNRISSRRESFLKPRRIFACQIINQVKEIQQIANVIQNKSEKVYHYH
ncbi:uncharacterized protein DS421_17g596460 [Arachis hypogaea]|nr:uncharacterized protein DS421_17g596460 [Arachis hypogaea]